MPELSRVVRLKPHQLSENSPLFRFCPKRVKASGVLEADAVAAGDVAVADTEQSNYNEISHGPVAESADAGDLKSPEGNTS